MTSPDALDRLAEPGRDLLGRVDALLTGHGAPREHPVWSTVRRLAALPGETMDAIAALRPAPLRAAADGIRRHTQGYAELPDLDDWAGPAADAFAACRISLVRDLATARDRLADTAGYLDDVADWMHRARRDMARALATVLGSEQAVAVRCGEPTDAVAIAVVVLDAADDAYVEGRALADRWVETAKPPVAIPGRPGGAVLRLPQ